MFWILNPATIAPTKNSFGSKRGKHLKNSHNQPALKVRTFAIESPLFQNRKSLILKSKVPPLEKPDALRERTFPSKCY